MARTLSRIRYGARWDDCSSSTTTGRPSRVIVVRETRPPGASPDRPSTRVSRASRVAAVPRLTEVERVTLDPPDETQGSESSTSRAPAPTRAVNDHDASPPRMS